MIRKEHFLKLHSKKQIYKLAETLHMLMDNNPSSNPKLTGQLKSYTGFMKEINSPQIDKALKIIETLPKDTALPQNGVLPRPIIEKVNFAFHGLMELIHEKVDESRFVSVQRQFDNNKNAVRFTHAAILDNLRSPFNVGSIFRSSDCFGVGSLALCGITPRPPMPKIERTAMGTLELIPWKYFEKTAEAAACYREKGFRIIGVETVKEAAPLYEAKWPEKSAFVFGNEEFGMMEETLGVCDEFVEIPLLGKKNSLNVASAFSVVMAEVMRRKAVKNKL